MPEPVLVRLPPPVTTPAMGVELPVPKVSALPPNFTVEPLAVVKSPMVSPEAAIPLILNVEVPFTVTDPVEDTEPDPERISVPFWMIVPPVYVFAAVNVSVVPPPACHVKD